MKIIPIKFLLLSIFFLSNQIHAAEDEAGRRAILELRQLFGNVRQKSFNLICDDKIKTPTEISSKISGGDVEARSAIIDLRKRLVNLQSKCGLAEKFVIDLNDYSMTLTDDELRRAILDMRQKFQNFNETIAQKNSEIELEAQRKVEERRKLEEELRQSEQAKSNTNGQMKIGPFISNFQASADFKSGYDAEGKARTLFTNDGIQSNIDFAMSGEQEGLFVVSWQVFEKGMAFTAVQLNQQGIPNFEFVKKSDTKVFVGSTNNANRFQYSITSATGLSNDNLTFVSKGKSRIVAYWVNLPIQFKNPSNEFESGMLSVFYRGIEAESKKIKIDSIISSFFNSLEFASGYKSISYENYKAEIIKKNIQRESETEVKTTVATDNKVDPSLSSKLTKPQLDLFELKEKQLEIEAKRLAEERRRLDAEKAQREQEKKASRIAIKGSASQPDANGDFTITIQTGADTASLKIDGEEVGGKRDGNYVIKRVARVGDQNSYLITARDVFGNTDSATVTVARQVADSRPAIPRLNPASVKVQQSRDAVAIIIGIENYRRVAKADFANADAKEFYTYASRALGIKPENIKLLVDDGADDIEMLNAFQNWLPLKVNKGKTDVYVFYSGHGYPSQDGNSLYFLPFNVDKQYLDRTSVKQKEVVSALQKAQAKSVTMFIDACYSGQTRGGEVLIAGLKPIVAKPDEKAYPAEFTVITASAADQFSSASQDLKHGIFSFYLMKGMEGDADGNKDGKITSGELQQYLSEMVGRQAMGLNRTQNTQLFGDANKVLVGR
jgi:hypothetical protein